MKIKNSAFLRVGAARLVSLILVSCLALLVSACGGGGRTPIVMDPSTIPDLPRVPDLPAIPLPLPDLDLPPSLDLPLGTRSLGTDMGTYASRQMAFEDSGQYDVRYTISFTNRTDTHLERINAAAAYADGWTGLGQVVAVIDTGFRDTHQELVGKTAGKVTDMGYTPTEADKFHGTAVASTVAGSRSAPSPRALNMQGVAFDARLHYTQIELGTSDGVYRPFLLENYNSLDEMGDAQFYSRLLEGGRASGARIINLSFGVSGAIATYGRAEVRSRFAKVASIFGQTHTYNSMGLRVPLSRTPADKSIFVWSAGNEGSLRDPATGAAPDHSSPEIFAGLGLYFPELQANTLAVVALDQDGTIANYSNRCGSAAAFCIAAPGSAIVTASNLGDADYRVISGTSFSAPVVSGALAVVAQRFPSLGSPELVTRLKASANKTGIYADHTVYGHGLLDLGAAIGTIGLVSLAGGALSQSFVTPSGSFGDALSSAFAGRLVAGFDSLNAPFYYPLNNFVRSPTRSTLQPLQTLHADLQAQPVDDASAYTSPPNHFTGAGGFALHGGAQAAVGGLRRVNADASSHMNLSHGGIGFAFAERDRLVFSAFADTTRNQSTPQVAGLSFTWRPQTDSGFAFGGGYLREADEVLQSQGGGAFGGLSAQTLFLAAGASREVNQWRLHGGAEVGVVMAEGERWLNNLSPLLTSSFSLSAARRLRIHDEIQFGLSSPLRIEQGEANITLPVGRTRDGTIQHIEINPSLTPSGRQLDLTATWQRRLPAGHVTLSARASHNPNHTATAAADIATLASYRLDF